MAYMNQEKKKQIQKLLKAIMPKSWKWSLAVSNHSTIVLNIRQADVDILEVLYQRNVKMYERNSSIGMYHPEPVKRNYESIYHKHVESYFADNLELKNLFSKIVDALNLNNHDNSNSMIDYFDVGHYVDINIGRYNKPFIVKN